MYRTLCLMIPRKYRQLILDTDLIYKAIPRPGDVHMAQLFVIWVNYVEPAKKEDGDCALCLQTIHNNYREIQSTLELLAKEDKLVDL